MSHTALLTLIALVAASLHSLAASPYSWSSSDKAARVAGLIPGRSVRMVPPEEFLLEWTRAQEERFAKDHAVLPPEEAYAAYSEAEPPDEVMAFFIPDHISPYGRLLSGETTKERAEGAMLTYCPLCGQEQAYPYTFAIPDPQNPYHAVTYCCKQDLYEREGDFPPDYKLRPNSTAEFAHLDGTVKKVPGYTFTDEQGCKWEIFPGTIVAYHRWLQAAEQARSFMNSFKDTGDPLYAHKLAALLDRVADAYYGLPLSAMNELATGKDGKSLTREEWEAWPRPVRAGMKEDRPRWNRRVPPSSAGWIFQYNELAWVEPFARVRHHPAFKYYSQKRYGDPEALDRKIMQKLMRELALIFESFPLTSDYQDGSYADLMMVGILLRDEYLFDFSAGHQECVLYNHHYHDGMNGEGAYNYMIMLDGYYSYMADPKGWLDLAPSFLQDNPFFSVASKELEKLHTVRGLPLEFGDEHIQAYDGGFQTDPQKVAEGERRPSMNWPGFGIGLLRVGGPGHRQELFMTYDRLSLHGASDKLGIECWVDGVPVMRDGGYAAPWDSAYLDETKPETQSVLALPYPHRLFESVPQPDKEFRCWEWAHGPWTHNTVTVDEKGTGPGWEDNEGLGEMLAFKGGEAPGELGSRFQVLDCRDVRSWERVGVPNALFRRTLLAVEGPDGRPYAVDILHLSGGQRHALYQHAWGEAVDEDLPAVEARETDLAAYWEKLRGPEAGELPSEKEYRQLRPVEVLGPTPRQWGLTWQTDYAAYAPFDASGQRTRPIPEDVGRVRLRLIGLGLDDGTTLLRARGPWVSVVSQPLPGGSTVQGNVGFEGGFDYLIESRSRPDGSIKSDYLHILEGFKEGEQTSIRRVDLLPAIGGTALWVSLVGGCRDTIVFQPALGGEFRGPDGTVTDACYALVRRDAKDEVLEAEMVRGSRLRAGEFAAKISGDLRGTIVDLIGDLTGTRQESALVIRPDSRWALGTGLAGRPLSVRVMNEHLETYTIEKVSALPDGLLRVDLQGHPPFTLGWYQVGTLDEAKPNRLYSNRQLWAGINTPLWWGCKAWFPERGRTFTIRKSETDRTTMDMVDGVDLKAAGIQPGDWFTVYAIEPGQDVFSRHEFTWRREPKPPADAPAEAPPEAQCFTLRTTGNATFTLPAATADVWMRVGAGPWRLAKAEYNDEAKTAKVTLDGDECAGQVVTLLAQGRAGEEGHRDGRPTAG